MFSIEKGCGYDECGSGFMTVAWMAFGAKDTKSLE